MLRLRRSTSASAPDISLGTITIYSRIVRSLTPAPIMDIDKAGRHQTLRQRARALCDAFTQVRALLSQLQQPSASLQPIIVHPQAQHLLENMQVRARSLAPPKTSPRCLTITAGCNAVGHQLAGSKPLHRHQ